MVNNATRDAIVWHYTTSAGKARLICQLFAKHRSADLAMSLRNLSC